MRGEELRIADFGLRIFVRPLLRPDLKSAICNPQSAINYDSRL